MAANPQWVVGEQPASDDRRALWVCTAGSVDDGKSTLLGRMLHDSDAIAKDQLGELDRASQRRGHARADLSLLTDGLRAEREQGITIDVAWRYVTTARRRLVLADSPGHERYTRNMATACSTADVAVVLVDARHGLKDQSRRHLAIAALFGVPSLVVAVNKMDLVDYSERAFTDIAAEARRVAAELGAGDLHVLPISALLGDNVVSSSTRTPYYRGAPLLSVLEGADGARVREHDPLRFFVQWVVRPQRGGFEDYRGYAGRVASGAVAVGDRVDVLPSGESARVVRIERSGVDVERASAGASVTLHFEDDIDVSRGDLLVRSGDAAPAPSSALECDLLWMGDAPLRVGARYRLKHGTRRLFGRVASVSTRLDPATLQRTPCDGASRNDLVRVTLETLEPVFADRYAEGRETGALLVVDEATRATVGAALVRAAR